MIRAAFLALLASALLASALLAGCTPQQPAQQQSGAPALWVVEDADGGTAGWLFGTIHALPDGAHWRTSAIDDAVERAAVLVVEVRDLDRQRLAVALEKLARDRPGPPLAERLSPGARRQLATLLAREGTSARHFDGLETWAAALALAQFGDAVEPGNGTDKALLASFARRPVVELEGAADQLAIFNALTERDQRAMLAAIIAEQSRTEPDRGALARAWLAGDTARMERLARTGLLADPALYEVLLARRNRSWMAAIVPMLVRGERPLIAVGAAHLLGRDGLPALLTAAGYTARRIQ